MILEKDNAARCAAMTKIRLRPEEAAMYEKELTDLFGWVEALAQVDTSAVAETSVVHAAYLRADTPVTDEALSQRLVEAFPRQENHCVQVKKVL